jgi:hypothetical protein
MLFARGFCGHPQGTLHRLPRPGYRGELMGTIEERVKMADYLSPYTATALGAKSL